VKFYESTVLGDITNNDWEGEIKDVGEKVYIRSVPTITVSDYQKGLTLTNQVPTSTPTTLNIDKGKYFSFICDDVDAHQADVKLMDTFSTDAAQQMKIAMDSQFLNDAAIRTAINAANKGATAGAKTASVNLGAATAPVVLTDGNTLLQKILDVSQVLDEANVPDEGRWIILAPWMIRLLKYSDLKLAYVTGDSQSVLRNGKVGNVDKFTVYVSNLLTGATDTGHTLSTHCLAGTKAGASFASQMTKMETLRSTSTFGNIVRGLNVYGYAVTKDTALVDCYFSKT
jgi:hypothetical protein